MYKPPERWIGSMLLKKVFFISVLFAVLVGCGQGLGDECGKLNESGVELRCAEGVCVYDKRIDDTICMEDNLPDGASCIERNQCQDDRQCYSDNPEALSGVCRHLTKLGETCHQRSKCGEGHCYKNVCTPNQPEGAKCNISQVKMCQGDLICGLPEGFDLPLSKEEFESIDWDDGTCRPGYAEGERCDGQLGLNCAPGLKCADFDVCKKEGER